jgi:putative nucleotidyltransferase with HDIG domain
MERDRQMEQDYIISRLEEIKLLPTFPNIVAEVLNIIDDPMSSASDLAKHLDPSMVGEILRIANSAYFGTRSFRSISTIEHAIAVIGYERLSYIILQMPFVSMVKGNDSTFDRNRFIRHSIVCAAVSNALSSATSLGNPNEVYLGGMMHDIGVIVIYRYFEDEWNSINSLIRERQMSRPDAEREVLSEDHGYIGATLLDLWNVPKPITDSVRFHHSPEEAKENREDVVVTFLGNALTRQINYTDDLASFADFMATHKDFTERVAEYRQISSPSDEIKIFEKIYHALKNANGCLEAVIGKDG